MTTELILAALLAGSPCAVPGAAPVPVLVLRDAAVAVDRGASTPVGRHGAIRVGSTRGAAPAAGPATPDGPPSYYAFDLVPTRRVPGTGAATGIASVTFAPSPFGISLAPDGSYLLDVHLDVRGLVRRTDGVYAAWVTTPSLDRVRRAGALDGEGRLTARVPWNKFLVVVTLEADDDPDAKTWSGPVVLRGMSRSGMMHTMAGHGPFEQENCAAYGYD